MRTRWRVPDVHETFAVTGGGSGIGLRVAERLLLENPSARCAVIDIAVGGAAKFLGEHQDRARTFEADVTDPAVVEDCFTAVADWAGPVTGLVNSAGVQFNEASIDLAYGDFMRVLEVHLGGTFLCSQAAARQMVAADLSGAIVNLASVSMFFGQPRRLPYAAAKAAIGSLTRTLAVEWAPAGIRVNAVAPGYVATPLVQEGVAAGHFDAQEAEELHALRRFGSTDEVAHPILFLLSAKASFMTGETVTVDGGFTVKKMPDGKRTGPQS